MAGRVIRNSNNYTGDASESRSIDVPDSSTDLQVNLEIDITQIKAIYIVSTQNVTLETNSGSTPTDTIALLANKPYVWFSDSYFVNKLTADVTTGIFLTNASGSAAVVDIALTHDATP